MNKPRVIRWVALLAGFILVALFALVLLLPMIVDSEAIKAKARAFVAEKTNGLARIEKIDLFWFPRPGVVIRDTAISFDKEIQGNVQQVRLYPSIRRLLTGNLAFSSITADGAAWIVRLPARDDEPFDLDEVEEKVRAAVKALASGFAGMNLRIHRSIADIGIAGGRTLTITDIEANLGVAVDKMDFKISARSNVAARIRFCRGDSYGQLAMRQPRRRERRLRKVVDFFRVRSDGSRTERQR
jgi:hypothetical protein